MKENNKNKRENAKGNSNKVKTKQKPNKKKKKTWKKVLLIILLLLLVAGGVFAYRVHKNGGGLSGILATAVGHDENTKKSLEVFIFLVL